MEAIQSILPVCDEVIVGLCESDGNTEEKVKSIVSDKIKLIPLKWEKPDNIDKHIYAYLTDQTIKHASGDWVFYIQGDECINESDYDKIRTAMKLNLENSSIQTRFYNTTKKYTIL